MIEKITVKLDFDQLPERTRALIRKAALRRGKTIGQIAQELLIVAGETLDAAGEVGTEVIVAEHLAGAAH